MDKIKINNQIVAMRKVVKQAKTHIINKWVKEIKRLQSRKGDENRILKCKRKADRLLLEISILHKIKPDSVSKMALSKDKDWKALLTQKNLPLEDRCYAVLANFRAIQMEVEKFHSANNYLVSRISTLVQEWDEKAKLTSQSPQKNMKTFKNSNKMPEMSSIETEINLNLKEVPKREEKREIGNTQQKSMHDVGRKSLPKKERKFSEKSSNASTSASEEEEEPMEENEEFSEGSEDLSVIGSPENLQTSENESKTVQSNLSSCDTNSSFEVENEEDKCHASSQKIFESVKTAPKSKSKPESVKTNLYKTTSVKMSNVNNSKNTTLQSNLSAESNSTKAVALLNLNEMLDMDEIPIENSGSMQVTAAESSKRKRDTFFLNDNGEDFSESDDNTDTDDDRQEADHSSFRKKPHYDFHRKGSYNEQIGGYKSTESNHNDFKNKTNSRNSHHGQKFGFRENGFKKSDRSFQPKESAGNFKRNQGRHNNFTQNKFNNFERNERMQENQFNKNRKWNMKDKNDSIDRKSFKSTSGKTFEKKLTNNKNRSDINPRNKHEGFNKAEKKNEPPLHPSWEAKRKLKESVKAKFQGKRIVFGD